MIIKWKLHSLHKFLAPVNTLFCHITLPTGHLVWLVTMTKCLIYNYYYNKLFFCNSSLEIPNFLLSSHINPTFLNLFTTYIQHSLEYFIRLFPKMSLNFFFLPLFLKLTNSIFKKILKLLFVYLIRDFVPKIYYCLIDLGIFFLIFLISKFPVPEIKKCLP